MRSNNSRSYNQYVKRENKNFKSKESISRHDLLYGIWKFVRSILILIVGLLLLFGGIYYGVDYALNNYWLPTSEYDTTEIQVEIPKGTSVSSIAEIMYNSGLVSNPKVFEYYIDFSGYGNKMQAGVYTMNKTMTMQEIMVQLSEGSGVAPVTDFMIIEGSSVIVTADKLLADEVISSTDEFLEAVKDVDSFKSYNFISEAAENKHESRYYVLEGYLYPAKYEIYIGSSPETIINKMLTKFADVYDEKFVNRTHELGMTIDEVVILASVIERESRPDDFAKVSAVFHNRIERDMKLESCASIQYILGTRKIKLTNEDISIDSKYNTYLYSGMPAGPICSPSEKAIEAALYPDETYVNDGYLFFATKDPESGELAFSKTVAEHEAVVAQYEQLWIEYDKKNGY